MKHHSIRNAMKKMEILLAVLCIWAGLFFLLLNTALRNAMAEAMDPQVLSVVLTFSNLFLAVISAAIAIAMLRKIFRLKSLLSVEPIPCLVEDFIITGYTSDGERKYKASLLVRDPAADQLLFTYEQYSLSFYNSSVIQAGHSLMDIRIFRKDGSVLQLGDTVDVYIKRFVNVTATQKGDKLLLNKKPFPFRHMNSAHGIHSLLQAKFYEGAVVIE